MQATTRLPKFANRFSLSHYRPVRSGPAVHVPDRFTNSHRKASSPRPATHETHNVASQKQLENTQITRKGDSNSQVPAPSLYPPDSIRWILWI